MRARLAALSAALIITFTGQVTVDAQPAQAATLARCPQVKLIAHRGKVDRLHIENTMRAFRHAYTRRARTMETDLRLTADHQWVLMHDETINRTTNGTGAVLGKTVTQLKRYRTDDGVLGGIPRLSQVLAFLQARPTARLQLEVKTHEADDAAIQNLLDLVNAYEVRDRVMLISFGTAPLSAVRRLDPDLRTGLLTLKRLAVSTVLRYGTTALVAQGAITPGYIELMARHGIAVNTFTVNTRRRWARAVRMGVASITTDVLPALRRYCSTA